MLCQLGCGCLKPYQCAGKTQVCPKPLVSTITTYGSWKDQKPTPCLCTAWCWSFLKPFLVILHWSLCVRFYLKYKWYKIQGDQALPCSVRSVRFGFLSSLRVPRPLCFVLILINAHLPNSTRTHANKWFKIWNSYPGYFSVPPIGDQSTIWFD